MHRVVQLVVEELDVEGQRRHAEFAIRTDIATVFLDNELNIKRFTEQAKELIMLRQTDAGRPIAYDGFLRDITGRKEAEEALQRLNVELEQRVA